MYSINEKENELRKKEEATIGHRRIMNYELLYEVSSNA